MSPSSHQRRQELRNEVTLSFKALTSRDIMCSQMNNNSFIVQFTSKSSKGLPLLKSSLFFDGSAARSLATRALQVVSRTPVVPKVTNTKVYGGTWLVVKALMVRPTCYHNDYTRTIKDKSAQRCSLTLISWTEKKKLLENTGSAGGQHVCFFNSNYF